MVCWMTDEPLRPRQRIAIKHTTRTVRAMVKELQYRLDVNTLHRDLGAGELGLNDIGRVRLRTTQPLFVDDYARNRVTGRFILIDEATNADGRRRDAHPRRRLATRGRGQNGPYPRSTGRTSKPRRVCRSRRTGVPLTRRSGNLSASICSPTTASSRASPAPTQ